MLCLGRELACVQLLDTLLQRRFPRIGQPLLVQTQVSVAAEGPGGFAVLRVLGRLAQEDIRLLRVLVARLEDVARDGQIDLDWMDQRDRVRLCEGDGDVVGRLRA